MPTYRVIDVSGGAIANEVLVEGAKSPEAAALDALGLRLVRSGHKSALVARVYWQVPGQPISMVRLYSMVDGAKARA